MNHEDGYRTAVDMFQREHRRWIENAVVLFAAIGALFAAFSQLKDLCPTWLILAIASLISAATTFVATSVRGSTDAWRHVVMTFERDKCSDPQPFCRYACYIRSFSYYRDFVKTVWIAFPAVVFSTLLLSCLWLCNSFIGVLPALYFSIFYFSLHDRISVWLPGWPPSRYVFSVTRWYTLLAISASLLFACFAWRSISIKGPPPASLKKVQELRLH